MTDTIGVQLVAQDAQFIASSKAAAAAVASISTQESKLAEQAKTLGVDGKKFAQQFAKVEQKRAADGAKQSKAAETAQKKDIADQSKKAKQAEVAQKKQAKAKQDYDKKFSAASKAQIAEAAAVATETLAIGAAAVAAVAGYVALAVAVGSAALKAAEAKSNALGFFNVLTNGRGDKLLAEVDRLAGSLGVKFNEARESFKEFRQAGLDNKQSAALLKLTSDLNTVDHSGKLAAEAVERTLAFTANHTQTAQQAEASAKTMALLAKQAHVAGDGTAAAAESVSTLVGALNRIDNSQTKALETIGERIKPSVDKAASSVATLVENFLASKRGKQAIDLVVTAISSLANGVTAAVPYVAKLGDQLETALANPYVQTALTGLKAIVIGTGVAVAVLAAGAALVAAPLVALAAAGVLVIGKLGELSVAAEHFGKDIVHGLISGFESGAGDLVKSVSNMASNVKNTFKAALGIASPSKVFAGFGVNIGAGVRIGLAKAMPTGAELADRLSPRTAANDNGRGVGADIVGQAQPAAPSAAGGPASSSLPALTINVTISGTASDEQKGELELVIRRTLDQWYSAKQEQRAAS